MTDQELLYAVIFFVGIIVGFRSGISHVRMQLAELIVKLEKDPDAFNDIVTKIKQRVIEIPILVTECHENVILLYNKGTNKFLCQGKTLEDVAHNLWSHEKVSVAIVEHDDKMLWFVDGEVQTEQP